MADSLTWIYVRLFSPTGRFRNSVARVLRADNLGNQISILSLISVYVRHLKTMRENSAIFDQNHDLSLGYDRDLGDFALRVVDKISAVVGYWDTCQTCRFANEAYREWFGKSRDEVIGISSRDLLGPLYPLNLPHILGALNGQVQEFEREIPLPDGSVRYSLTTYTPDIVNGITVGFFAHVADITPIKMIERELRAAKERAEALATHDFLTGLPNRVLFAERFASALATAKRYKRPLVLMMADLDEFKTVNDRFGHPEGDRLLIAVAERISAVLRESDTLARFGGDEFTVLAPEVETMDDATHLVRRIAESVETPYLCQYGTVTPSLSMGIALYPNDGLSQEALIAAADHAMYEAKNHRLHEGNGDSLPLQTARP